MPSDEIMKTLGKRLRECRKRVFPSDTQEFFAHRLEVERKTVLRMEKGDPAVSFGTYVSAAILLNCQSSLESLFTLPVQAPPLKLPKQRRIAA